MITNDKSFVDVDLFWYTFYFEILLAPLLFIHQPRPPSPSLQTTPPLCVRLCTVTVTGPRNLIK